MVSRHRQNMCSHSLLYELQLSPILIPQITSSLLKSGVFASEWRLHVVTRCYYLFITRCSKLWQRHNKNQVTSFPPNFYYYLVELIHLLHDEVPRVGHHLQVLQLIVVSFNALFITSSNISITRYTLYITSTNISITKCVTPSIPSPPTHHRWSPLASWAFRQGYI